MSWAVLMVEHLRQSRRAGETDHEAAWAAAMKAHPPRRRDFSEPPASLFDEPLEGLVEFTKRVTADAWYGRRPMPNFERDLMLLRGREPGPRVALPA